MSDPEVPNPSTAPSDPLSGSPAVPEGNPLPTTTPGLVVESPRRTGWGVTTLARTSRARTVRT